MRRLARLFLRIATALSLALCLTTAAACARSYAHGDEWSTLAFDDTGRYFVRKILSHRGQLAYAVEQPTYRMYSDLPRTGWRHHDFPADPSFVLANDLIWQPTALQRQGFIYHRAYQKEFDLAGSLFVPYLVLALPYGFLSAALALAPAIAATRHLHARRARLRLARGLCPTCGYDLRATRDRCPECGTPTPHPR